MLEKNWFGNVTVDNLEEIAQLMCEILKDNPYTFVAVNMYGVAGGWAGQEGELISRPEVRTSQRLKDDGWTDHKKAWYHSYFDHYEENKGSNKPFDYGGFHFSDTYGVWGLSTRREVNPDKRYDIPYVTFEWNKFTIIHRAPAGHILYWVIATEVKQDV